MSIICNTIELEGRKIELIAETPKKVICSYTIPSLSADAVTFTSASKAITSVAGQLTEVGKFINAQQSLESITKNIEAIIPPLSLLKVSDSIIFTQMLEIHPIDQTSFTIAIKLDESKSPLGCVKIDGVGFQIKVTKTS